MLSTVTSDSMIRLRGVSVHNLRDLDLDLPHHRLIVICGVSGSGKSSLALDTLYAEGQRRYIECFSAHTRQFLEQLDKPEAESIDGIPAAIAVTRSAPSRSSRATVGTATETSDYLRLLLSRVGQTVCPDCQQPVLSWTADMVANWIVTTLPAGSRVMAGFRGAAASPHDWESAAAQLREQGFLRAVLGGRTVRFDEPAAWEQGLQSAESYTAEQGEGAPASGVGELWVIVDRWRVPEGAWSAQELMRVRDSLETAFAGGGGEVCVWSELPDARGLRHGFEIDGQNWSWLAFSNRQRCASCQRDFPDPEPQLFSFNSPLGACPRCEGFGNLIELDMDLIVPDATKSIREGAIAPWNTPAYRHELKELIALADDYSLPLDVPFAQLEPPHLQLIREGVPERKFGGLNGFFQWLEKRKYKMHLRVYLSRWRSARPCPDCGGSRLRQEALARRIGGLNLAELSDLKISAVREFFRQLPLNDHQCQIARTMLEQVNARLAYLDSVGLGYLSLSRMLRTLSGGEAQRVALTAALGSSLVNMLYVLDEPSVGLHPSDTDRLLKAITSLRDRGNTVVVVEHEESLMRAADHIVEIGPAAGDHGGEVVFTGTPEELIQTADTVTGDYLSGRRGRALPTQRRSTTHGWLKLSGARGHNLRDLTVEFPLGVLCVVTGVSGSGKSTLVEDTLYPAVCRRKRKEAPKPLPYTNVVGDGQIDDVVLVDQSPIGRSPRSIPITYVKAFDAIRHVFAETVTARTHNFGAGHFSFNVDGGRCNTCEGDGYIQIDMQFMADVYMRCRECKGNRYRKEILEVTYRGRNIAEVLDMTAREAFSFFRGQTKVQARLRHLLDVGLDYLKLGQPANTLSAGEAQRLKLASYLATARRSRTLFLLDEPTTGLHFADVVKLLDCFEALLSHGHSLIVVEHNLQLIKAADYLIDLGPGAGDEGGQVVVAGTPEDVAQHAESLTARFLRPVLAAGRSAE